MSLEIENVSELFLANFKNYITVKERNIMPRLDIRLSDETKSRLDTLSAKTGFSSSEIVRKFIDNCDEVTLSLALTKIDERKQVDLEKIASLKYQNYLLQNAANNLNQLAHYVNAETQNSNNELLVKNFQIMAKNFEKIYGKLR